uniref:SXP/RAL-2 family protein Ani s 5-like cation-binding domain-containing protein n=1 Tax=Panagrellus redivivus TaxID=6233 RepID=A0A7E4VJL1_PANRE
MKFFLLTLLILGYAAAKMDEDEIGFDFHYNCNIGLEIPLDGYVKAIKSLFDVPDIAKYLNPEEISKKIDEVVDGIKKAFDQLKRLPSLDELLKKGGELAVDAAEEEFKKIKDVFSGVTVQDFAKLLQTYNMTLLVDTINAGNNAIGAANQLTSAANNASNANPTEGGILGGLTDKLPIKLPEVEIPITVPKFPHGK